MPISSVSANYTGRTRDLLIFGKQNPYSSAPQLTSMTFGDPSRYTTGVVKLLQKYALVLLTRRGSQLNNPSYGTTLLSDLYRYGTGLTLGDVQHIFNFANIDATAYLRQIQARNPQLHPEEKLSQASLTNLHVNGTSVSLTIAIVTEAGETVPFVMPLPL